jgi:hypothetical protein
MEIKYNAIANSQCLLLAKKNLITEHMLFQRKAFVMLAQRLIIALGIATMSPRSIN